ncbi:Sodium channel protein Nach [Habropoda laboriosa]|uniref:Sodium channel protein Nach n=1 Tax=Habropoda laboriosa TaxID=597456 RepID=A0A0L7RDT9_9HYME|nr:Sodium channel protein Nach [Habropoda laboriosa]
MNACKHFYPKKYSCFHYIELGSRSTFTQTVKRSFRVYCENTGLHGFRYIVTSKTTFDKTIWFTICLSALVFCVMLMLRLWHYFSNNPTVTIIDTSNPIRELHFPGITICNNNKVFKPHADKIAEKLLINGFDSDMSNKLFSSLMKLIRPDKIEIDNATASLALDILGYSVDRLMLELMQPCNLLLVRCSWLGKLYDCNKIFKTVKSNEGFCCGFNYHYDLSADYSNEYAWLMNITMIAEDLHKSNSSDTLPGVGKILHVPGTGRDIGLAVALNIDPENYKSSVRQFVGATVLIHDPQDYPDIGAQSVTLQPAHVMAITLAGTKIQSSKDIQNIPLRKRMCLFDGETPGERAYSYQTCISECIQQKTYGSCGCLPFFYPDEHPNERTCYLTDVDCILAHRRNLSQVNLSHINDCNCLPQCNDKSYEVVSESIPVGNVGYDSEITRNLNIKNTSFLYVYFRDATYLEYRKETIIGWDSLLASFGGIFGLCLGGSVISLVEFLYYLLTDFFGIRKRKERIQNDLPPASKLFVSMPTNMHLKKCNTTLNQRTFLEWNQ